MTIQSDQFMQQAIDLALQGQGRTAPNPPVGAIVVKNGQVVGTGYHPLAGQPHAEVFALQAAAENARGADLYVTLEPCCHQGRTGPCTEAILAAGVARVMVGIQDPNPQVAGKGIAHLRAAGLEVQTGLLEAQCSHLIAPFAKHLATGMPFILYKAAMTLDGQIASSEGDSRWISCAESRRLVHQLRDRVDAIMVGSGTVIADDPQLTTRLDDGGRDAVRVVLDSTLKTSPQATLYTQSSQAKTLLVTAEGHSASSLAPYRNAGAEIITVPRTAEGLNLEAVMLALGRRNLQYVMLEGGGRLARAMLQAAMIDRMMIFVAPKLLGGAGKGLFDGPGVASIQECCKLVHMRSRQIDTDILIEGEVHHVHRAD